jgi:ectoine hydroxylase-related dioxygenase (phytanoyl-CoA dioxygenase family)
VSLRQQLDELGYAVARRAVDAAGIARLAEEFDRVAAGPGDDDDLRRVHTDDGRQLRFAQRSGHLGARTRELWRSATGLRAVVDEILGRDARVVLTSLFYKPPGAVDDDIGYHQDFRFRQPPEAFRDLARNYVQLGVAVDPHGPANGGMRVLPRSHLAGDAGLCRDGGVSRTAATEEALVAAGLDPGGLVALELDPGDVAMWSPYVVHGSPHNLSPRPRRFFVCGLARASSTETGEPAVA